MADPLRGQIPLCLVVMKDGRIGLERHVEEALIQLVRDCIGAVAFFKHVLVVKRLPKTRSGKILRRILRNIADDESYQVPVNIEDPAVLGEIHHALQARHTGIAFAG